MIVNVASNFEHVVFFTCYAFWQGWPPCPDPCIYGISTTESLIYYGLFRIVVRLRRLDWYK